MPNEATAVKVQQRDVATAAEPIELQPHVRLMHGMRRPANWLQLVRFGLVGGAGFVVNVAVYALFVHEAGFEYRVASVVAWLVAVINNFILNRHWTFDAREGRAHFQAMRFLAVSLIAEIFSLLLLTLFVESAGLAKVPAQALAVAASMPFNFLGNKLWTFRSESTAEATPDA
jgi:putative flippase GtrA